MPEQMDETTRIKVALIAVALCVCVFAGALGMLRIKYLSRELEQVRAEKAELIKLVDQKEAARRAAEAEVTAAENKLAMLQNSNDERVRKAAQNAIQKYDDMCGEDIIAAWAGYLAECRDRNAERRAADNAKRK